MKRKIAGGIAGLMAFVLVGQTGAVNMVYANSTDTQVESSIEQQTEEFIKGAGKGDRTQPGKVQHGNENSKENSADHGCRNTEFAKNVNVLFDHIAYHQDNDRQSDGIVYVKADF